MQTTGMGIVNHTPGPVRPSLRKTPFNTDVCVYVCVCGWCVCACVRVCVRARARVRAFVRARVRVRVRCARMDIRHVFTRPVRYKLTSESREITTAIAAILTNEAGNGMETVF